MVELGVGMVWSFGLCFATRLVGYSEFLLAAQRVRDLLVSLLRVPSPDEPRQIEMCLDGYHACWERGSEPNEDGEGLWHAQIPLVLKGRSLGKLEISGRRKEESLGDKIAILAKMVQDFEDNVSLLAESTVTPQQTSDVSVASLPRTAGWVDQKFQRADL
jgi:hypothetical protein